MAQNYNMLELLVKATQLIQADPQNAEAYKMRASVLFQMKQYDEALEDINYLIESLDGQDAQIYLMRGRIRMERGDEAGALDDVRKAASLNPHIFDGLEGSFESKESGHC